MILVLHRSATRSFPSEKAVAQFKIISITMLAIFAELTPRA
jgi:hypothetical protein